MKGGRKRVRATVFAAGLALMAATILCLMTRADEDPKNVHRVKPKDDPVHKNARIDKENNPQYPDYQIEEVAPQEVTVAQDGKVTIVTKTFKPPEKKGDFTWKFERMTGDDETPAEWKQHNLNPNWFVDVCIDPHCLPPTPEVDWPEGVKTLPANVDSIKVTVTKLTAPQTAGEFPLKCEGNLKKTVTGKKGKEVIEHWSAKMPTIAVEILDDDEAWWTKEYYPKNWKLIIGAAHPMVADGEPDGQGYKYLWSYDRDAEGQSSFAPNDETANVGNSKHKTQYTPPDGRGSTSANEKDTHKVHCKYYKDNQEVEDADGETDPPPLNITAPKKGFASMTKNPPGYILVNFSQTKRFQATATEGDTVTFIECELVYDIVDQFSEPITESDLGEGDRRIWRPAKPTCKRRRQVEVRRFGGKDHLARPSADRQRVVRKHRNGDRRPSERRPSAHAIGLPAQSVGRNYRGRSGWQRLGRARFGGSS